MSVVSSDDFKGKDVVSVKQFHRGHFEHVFSVAKKMQAAVEVAGGVESCKGKILANVFYEPSTRTSSSFQAAMMRLGGQVIVINDVKTSSVAKGETLSDTCKSLESYVDVMVLRHPQIGAAKEAADAVSIPVLNGGDGAGEHPTQALLDMFTMLSELNTLDGLTVTMVGDLKHGRTVHSLAQALSHFKVKLNYVSPDILQMPSYVKEAVNVKGIEQKEYTDLSSCLAETDVLYVTRVQKERFEDENQYKQVADLYIITPKLLDDCKAKETLRILHPLPRVNEISTEVDKDPRAAYFRQMKYGLYVRMALLALVLGRA